jgi:hypothetical protein
MKAHTPGPWKVIHKYEDSWTSDGFIVEGVLGTHIVPDGGQELGDELADYQLMAAAPELLAALRYIEGLAMSDDPRDLPSIIDIACAAIAKATAQTANTDAVTLRAESNSYAWRNAVHCADMTMTSKVFVNELTDAGRSLPPGTYRLMAVRQN